MSEQPVSGAQQKPGPLSRASLQGLTGALRRVFEIDQRSLALFRVSLAVLLLLDLGLRSFDMRAFYTDQGVLPRSYWLMLANPWHTSIHGANGQLWWQVLLFLVAAGFALGLLVGWRTRWMATGSFFMLLSLMNRNVQILQAGDLLLVTMSFWSLFLPIGARFSIDAALRPALEKDPNDSAGASERHFSPATIAVILQVLFLYFFTALLKTGDAWRVRFDAAFYAVSLQQYATPIGTWISQFPALLKASTVYVLAVEFLAPVLVLVPIGWPWTRIVGLLLLASLHVAFILMLHIGLFPLIDFMALSLLIPSAAWMYLSRWRDDAALRGIVIYYDRDCGFCLKMCLILREFLLPRDVRILPAQSDPPIGEILEREYSWVVRDGEGNIHLHWEAMQFLFSRRWPFKPIGWLMALPPLMRLGHRLYLTVGANRTAMGLLSARFLPYQKPFPGVGWVGGVLAVFFLVIVSLFNIGGLPGWQGANHRFVDATARLFRVEQQWGMFAPYPLTSSYYPVIAGTLRSGERVSLYEHTSIAPDWVAPPRFYRLYPSYRWRKYFENAQGAGDKRVLEAYGRYLCLRHNRPGIDRMKQVGSIDVTFEVFVTNPDGAPKERRRKQAWTHWCFPEFAPKPPASGAEVKNPAP